MSALNNLRKKGISLTLGEDEPFTEKVRSYPCFYDKPWKETKERMEMSWSNSRNAWSASNRLNMKKVSCKKMNLKMRLE